MWRRPVPGCGSWAPTNGCRRTLPPRCADGRGRCGSVRRCWPRVGWVVGWTPRRWICRLGWTRRWGDKHTHSARVGGLICFVGMPIMWFIFIAAIRSATDDTDKYNVVL
jgi:hypothetical protein